MTLISTHQQKQEKALYEVLSEAFVDPRYIYLQPGSKLYRAALIPIGETPTKEQYNFGAFYTPNHKEATQHGKLVPTNRVPWLIGVEITRQIAMLDGFGRNFSTFIHRWRSNLENKYSDPSISINDGDKKFIDALGPALLGLDPNCHGIMYHNINPNDHDEICIPNIQSVGRLVNAYIL